MTTTTDELIYSGSSNRIESVERNSSAFRTFTHDAAGNMATSVQGGVTTAYTYNHADRLASFTRGGSLIGTYTHNAQGQLVIRTVTNTVPSGVTVYFYDQEGHVIAEYDGVSGLLKREYIWLGDVPVAVIDPGTPSTTYYVHTDHLNRPIAMTNSGKSFVARYVWTAFGELHSYTGTKGIDLRFPGQLFQAESGLHYNWFRTYDPTIGRYTQPDPLGLLDGTSRYAYVRNDPMQKVDPTGLASFGKTEMPFGYLGPLPYEYAWEKFALQTDLYHNFSPNMDLEICTAGAVCQFNPVWTSSFGAFGYYLKYCTEGAWNGTQGHFEIGIDYPWLYGSCHESFIVSLSRAPTNPPPILTFSQGRPRCVD